jgi:phosphoglycolate phosphatase
LKELKQAGTQLYLATSKRMIFARRILDYLNLTSFFDGVYGSEPGGALDHKPELISHILSQHALTQSSCVMVGDRRYNISGAHANRMRALGVLWGYGTRDELEAAGADRLVARPELLAEMALATMRVE